MGFHSTRKRGRSFAGPRAKSGPRQRVQRTVGENQQTLVTGDQRLGRLQELFVELPRAGGEPACGIRSRRSAKAEQVALRRDGLTERSVVAGKSVDRQPGPLRSGRLQREKKRALLADRVSEKKRSRVEGRARAIEAERLRIAERRPLRRRLLDLLEGFRAPIAESRAPFNSSCLRLCCFASRSRSSRSVWSYTASSRSRSCSSPEGRPEEARGRAPRSS